VAEWDTHGKSILYRLTTHTFESCPDYLKINIMVVTYIVNVIFILFILFIVWFIICSIIYREKDGDDFSGQSDRQKKNDDYNTDYYP
jgi:hypothetical protein